MDDIGSMQYGFYNILFRGLSITFFHVSNRDRHDYDVRRFDWPASMKQPIRRLNAVKFRSG